MPHHTPRSEDLLRPKLKDIWGLFISLFEQPKFRYQLNIVRIKYFQPLISTLHQESFVSFIYLTWCFPLLSKPIWPIISSCYIPLCYTPYRYTMYIIHPMSRRGLWAEPQMIYCRQQPDLIEAMKKDLQMTNMGLASLSTLSSLYFLFCNNRACHKQGKYRPILGHLCLSLPQ